MTSGDNRTDDETAKETVAVALDYDPDRDRAPKVLAGGRGAIAEQILEIAFANGVKVREDADLAELLSSIDLESEIPTEAFPAVAEILIYVYRANGDWPSFLDEAMGGTAPHRDPVAGHGGEHTP
ncbi:MAG: EscU/YscU/HrcU family type III secretion system export apparatus switch protein [Rhodospirillales bacterium]